MKDILISVLFGIIEGITEWFPVSSTGHMLIFNNLVSFDVSKDFYNIYEVFIQFGAVLAVLLIYIDRLWPFGKTEDPLGKGLLSYVKKDKFILWCKIAVTCIPVVVISPFDDYFKTFFYNPTSVATALIVVGILYIVEEVYLKNRKFTVNTIGEISFTTALLIGIIQILAAVFPGVSRSGITILGALLLGVSRTAATEYTFYLAIPVMFGASLLKIMESGLAFSALEYLLLSVGMITAFVVSVFVINFMKNYVRKHGFTPFGIYRILLGVTVLVYFSLI